MTKVTFLWMSPNDGKRRPRDSGQEVLAKIYGESFKIEARELPSHSSLPDEETTLKIIRAGMTLVGADFLIIEGCRVNLILRLLTEGENKLTDQVLFPVRSGRKGVERFEIMLPGLATKPFPNRKR